MPTIRKLKPYDDLAAVLELCKAFFAEYEQHHVEFFDTDNLGDDHISGRFIESLNSDTSATIIALVDDKIVGYASVIVRDQAPFYKIKKIGSISALMVAKEYRRQGIGGAILEECRKYFQEKGLKYFTFFTSSNNQTAINLYKKLGFKELHTSFLGKT